MSRSDDEREEQAMTMTPEQLHGLDEALSVQRQCDEDGVLCAVSRQAVDAAREVVRAHADALDEIKRLNVIVAAQSKLITSQSIRLIDAEQAERMAERLGRYAELAMSWIEDKHPDEAKQYLPDFVDAYRAEFKE